MTISKVLSQKEISHNESALGEHFDSHAQVLVNPINCVGVMGKGLALEFKRRYPVLLAMQVAR